MGVEWNQRPVAVTSGAFFASSLSLVGSASMPAATAWTSTASWS
jgi:hypothetical protein